MAVHCSLLTPCGCHSCMEVALILLLLPLLLAIALTIHAWEVNTRGWGNLGKVVKWSYASSTHWLYPKRQGIPLSLSSRNFFTTHGTGTCTPVYTISYVKATLRSTRVELASIHIRMWVGSNLGSTQIHQKRVQCRHTQHKLNPSSNRVQVAVQLCLEYMYVFCRILLSVLLGSTAVYNNRSWCFLWQYTVYNNRSYCYFVSDIKGTAPPINCII